MANNNRNTVSDATETKEFLEKRGWKQLDNGIYIGTGRKSSRPAPNGKVVRDVNYWNKRFEAAREEVLANKKTKVK